MKKAIQNKIQKFKELEKKLEDLKKQQVDIELQMENLWEHKKNSSTSNDNATNGSVEKIPYTEEVLKIFRENANDEFRANNVKELMENKLGAGSTDIGSIKSTIIYLSRRGKIQKMSRGKYKLAGSTENADKKESV